MLGRIRSQSPICHLVWLGLEFSWKQFTAAAFSFSWCSSLKAKAICLGAKQWRILTSWSRLEERSPFPLETQVCLLLRSQWMLWASQIGRGYFPTAVAGEQLYLPVAKICYHWPCITFWLLAGNLAALGTFVGACAWIVNQRAGLMPEAPPEPVGTAAAVSLNAHCPQAGGTAWHVLYLALLFWFLSPFMKCQSSRLFGWVHY